MNETFAKLFNINNYQVLVTKIYDQSSKKHYLTFQTKINNEQLRIKIAFDTEEEINTEYDSYDIIQAIIFRETTQKFRKESTPFL